MEVKTLRPSKDKPARLMVEEKLWFDVNPDGLVDFTFADAEVMVVESTDGMSTIMHSPKVAVVEGSSVYSPVEDAIIARNSGVDELTAVLMAMFRLLLIATWRMQVNKNMVMPVKKLESGLEIRPGTAKTILELFPVIGAALGWLVHYASSRAIAMFHKTSSAAEVLAPWLVEASKLDEANAKCFLLAIEKHVFCAFPKKYLVCLFSRTLILESGLATSRFLLEYMDSTTYGPVVHVLAIWRILEFLAWKMTYAKARETLQYCASTFRMAYGAIISAYFSKNMTSFQITKYIDTQALEGARDSVLKIYSLVNSLKPKKLDKFKQEISETCGYVCPKDANKKIMKELMHSATEGTSGSFEAAITAVSRIIPSFF